jgi:hypothetical protein
MFRPDSTDELPLTRLHLIDKCGLSYELNNRAAWAGAPTTGLLGLARCG